MLHKARYRVCSENLVFMYPLHSPEVNQISSSKPLLRTKEVLEYHRPAASISFSFAEADMNHSVDLEKTLKPAFGVGVGGSPSIISRQQTSADDAYSRAMLNRSGNKVPVIHPNFFCVSDTVNSASR